MNSGNSKDSASDRSLEERLVQLQKDHTGLFLGYWMFLIIATTLSQIIYVNYLEHSSAIQVFNIIEVVVACSSLVIMVFVYLIHYNRDLAEGQDTYELTNIYYHLKTNIIFLRLVDMVLLGIIILNAVYLSKPKYLTEESDLIVCYVMLNSFYSLLAIPFFLTFLLRKIYQNCCHREERQPLLENY